VWLKENLNIQTADSWCYGEGGQVWDGSNYVTISSSEVQANCAKYGRLYTYAAAVSACELLGSGWHLPTREEWGALAIAAGGTGTYGTGGYGGRNLKSVDGWNYYSASYYGTDSLGFSALPGGRRYTDGSFGNAGSYGFWWTAAEDGSGNAYRRGMHYGYDLVDEYNFDKGDGLSVRCRGDSETSYTVIWNTYGGTPVPTQTTVNHGGNITLPATMTKIGYTFGGWYTNSSLTMAASFPITNVTSNITFHAKWTINSTGGGGNNQCTGAGMCKTVTIGGQLWLAENLNIETPDSWCYGEDGEVYDSYTGELATLPTSEVQANCGKYGRLYTWSAAKSACQLLGDSWHLPTQAEWDSLARFVGKAYNDESYRYNAGMYLKSETGWNAFRGTENKDMYGFSALPGGYYGGSAFTGAGLQGHWWTSKKSSIDYRYAEYRSMYYNIDAVGEGSGEGESFAAAVRCRGD
jgi:uncharacterized protein (TIGR02145 family)/uncharacterized repeat protein (TIGR02543 family)